jgi:diguanylate cyclase (GGDEF)-like protein/PAS domain S-box-containing protein
MNELQQTITMKLQSLRQDLCELSHLRNILDELESLLAALTGNEEHLAREMDQVRSLISDWYGFFMRSPNLLCITDSKGYFRRVNPAMARALGYRSQDLVEHCCIDFVHPDDRNATQHELQRLASGHDTLNFENRYRCRNGKYRWLNWTCPAILPASGLIYAMARDVTESKRNSDEILFLAQHDSLTGLHNRASFRQELLHACARARRSQPYEVIVLFIDLNEFKAINDTYGHASGDMTLTAVAERLLQVARSTDVVARIGGDEFTMLIQGSPASRIDRLVQRIHQSLSRPVQLPCGDQIRISASIGVSRWNDDNDDADSLLDAADHSMYADKASCRQRAAENRHVI